MASVLGDTTCTIHADRQGTARCPSCRQFYCTECITEHNGKLTCASCLALKVEQEGTASRTGRIVIAPVIQFLLALVICWVLFYLFAQSLADVPDEFHDGTIWE